jgi:hypothetical protein
VATLGVGCVSCHVTEAGSVLAAASLGDNAAAPHPVERSPEFAGAGACAGCHEFKFPGAFGDEAGDHMQTTVREHTEVGGDESCADCHMPLVEGARSHTFAAVRDPAWLRANLVATATHAEGTLRVTLAQPRPGHAFPTGDLFRRLEVGCELRDAGRVVARQVRYLARHFRIERDKPLRQLHGDDRVTHRPRTVDLPLPSARGTAVWWVTYQRVATAGRGDDPSAAEIESQVVLHTGELPWPPRAKGIP